jgi:AcrR family transcriptional regulator
VSRTASARTALSRERVLAAAMRLADSAGLPAVTMRRVAADLGVEAMSLYYHLPGKQSLLDGLVDAAVADIQREIDGSARGDEEWRAEVRRRCLAAREVMKRHPWAPGLIGSRTTIPASVYGLYEAVLAAFVEGGLSYRLAHKGLHALGSMILGFAQEVFSPASAGGSVDVESAETDLEHLAESLPHLTAMVASELHDHADDPLGWCDSQSEFQFTLDLILDGLRRGMSEAERGTPQRNRHRAEPDRTPASDARKLG